MLDRPTPLAFDTLSEVPAVVGHRVRVEVLQAGVMALDVVLVTLTGWFARLVHLGPATADLDDLPTILGDGLFAGLLFVLFLGLRGAYSAGALGEARLHARLVVQGWLFTFFVLGWFAFLTKTATGLSRGAVSLHFVFGLLVLLAVHVAGARLLAHRFARGALSLRRVSVVTATDDVGIERVRARLAAAGIEVVSLTALSPGRLGHPTFLSACREIVDDVRAALATAPLDGVWLFLPWGERRRIDEIRAALSVVPVPLFLFADPETERVLSCRSARMGRLTGFEIARAPLSRTDRALKRALDIVVAGSALVLLAPLLGLVSLAVMIESGRPILFKQDRKGFGARPFRIWKFRSMTVQENGGSVTQASRGDARVTRLGRILRKTSIDELPQLVNVLRGDMSIVGPRPHAVAHDDLYDGLIATYALRQHVKPGITGWAQVNGHRGETREIEQMSARVEHDLWYINHWSLWLDLRIIAMTAAKVLFDDTAF